MQQLPDNSRYASLLDNEEYNILRGIIEQEIEHRKERLVSASLEDFQTEQGFVQGMRFVNEYLERGVIIDE